MNLPFLRVALATIQPAANPLAPLTAYDGNWLVSPRPAAGETQKIDHLTNHCHMADVFYTCEQVLNGKSMALLVFSVGTVPGTLHSTIGLPDGSPGGKPGDLTIAGNHWTFLNSDAAGKPTFRLENYFKDRDHIHFEQYQPKPDGSSEKVGEGDEVRVQPLQKQ